MVDVFISKSSKDDAFVNSLCQKIEENGISCWISHRDLSTHASEHYGSDIVEAIEDSRALLFVLSRNSNRSEHCMRELSSACDLKKKVYVYQVEEVEPNKSLEYYLSQDQWLVDFEVLKTGNYERIIREVALFLEKKVGNNADSFIDREYQKQENLKQLHKRTWQKRQSYVLSIVDETESEIDKNHLYGHIIRMDVVDSELNKWTSYRQLTIKNMSDSPTTYIVHRECGECKADFKEMKIYAKLGGVSGDKLKVESLTDIQPNVKQVFRIIFPSALDPGEEITIFYRLGWPNEPSAYYMKELTQSISLSRYMKGVGKLTFEVFEPYKILSSTLGEVDDMNIEKTTDIKPEMIDITEEPLLSPLHGETYHGVRYVINEPNAKLYQIRYIKEDNYNPEDDEDFF